MEQTLLQFINDNLADINMQLEVEGISHGQASYLRGQMKMLLAVLNFLLEKGVRA